MPSAEELEILIELENLERVYHSKNDKVNSHKREIEHQKQPNNLEILFNAGLKKASVVECKI